MCNGYNYSRIKTRENTINEILDYWIPLTQLVKVQGRYIKIRLKIIDKKKSDNFGKRTTSFCDIYRKYDEQKQRNLNVEKNILKCGCYSFEWFVVVRWAAIF